MTIESGRIDELFNVLSADAKASGYYLSPDTLFVKELIRGLLVNKDRYGYISCPCRLSTGKRTDDLDIICPCDYRDIDLNEYGACYCGLYVSKEIADGKKVFGPIPERRKRAKTAVTESKSAVSAAELSAQKLKYPVHRCKVCGYLCARDHAPDKCPICKADKDRFERFM